LPKEGPKRIKFKEEKEFNWDWNLPGNLADCQTKDASLAEII